MIEAKPPQETRHQHDTSGAIEWFAAAVVEILGNPKLNAAIYAARVRFEVLVF